jgi:hypothetical protein
MRELHVLRQQLSVFSHGRCENLSFPAELDGKARLAIRRYFLFCPARLTRPERKRGGRLAAAYSDAPLGQNVASPVTNLEHRRVALCRLDKSLSEELIKDDPLVGLQIGVGSLQQIAKNRNFEVRKIFCHDIGLSDTARQRASTRCPRCHARRGACR